jgi:hypothetical protein
MCINVSFSQSPMEHFVIPAAQSPRLAVQRLVLEGLTKEIKAVDPSIHRSTLVELEPPSLIISRISLSLSLAKASGSGNNANKALPISSSKEAIVLVNTLDIVDASGAWLWRITFASAFWMVSGRTEAT